MRRFLPVLLALAGTVQAATTPFGIPLTATLPDLQAMDGTFMPGPNVWIVARPPQPDARFEAVLVQYSPTFGVCAVSAMQRVKSDETGAGARQALDALRAELERTYGPAIPLDRLNEGSRLTGPRQWLAGVAARERLYSAAWLAGKQALPEDLSGVIVNVSTGRTTRDVFVSVQYRAAAYELCMSDPGESAAG